MKKLLIILLSFITTMTFAQVLKPAQWTAKLSKTEAKVGETIEVIFTATIEKDWYIYSADLDHNIGPIPTTFKFNKDASFALVGTITQNDKPIKKHDEIWGAEISYYKEKAIFSQKITLLSKKLNLIANVDGQTCTEVGGKCIQFEEEFTLKNIIITEDIANKTNDKNITNQAKDTTKKSLENTTNNTINNPENKITDTTKSTENSQISEIEKPENNTTNNTENKPEKESLLGFALLAFLGGLAALLTPCVFPMIPMTVSFFTSKQKKRSEGIFQAMFYGFSIIGIYTFIGFVVSRFFGADAANWLSTHWLPNLLFFAIFLVFAFSFFGAYEIVMPHQLVNSMDAKAEKGGLIGVFFMAFTLVLVSFSCTGPIAGSILVQSANGQVLKPVIGMFAFSSAFAIPFTLFALFPSWLKTLPKSGGWLNSVKVVLGFVELALALKFLSTADQVYHWGILPRHVYLAFWIAIFACMGLYLLGKIRLSHDSKEDSIGTLQLILAILTFSFVIYLIPGMFGSPLKALAGYLPPQTSSEFDLVALIRQNTENNNNFGKSSTQNSESKRVKYGDKFQLPHGLKGYFEYNEALAASKAENKPIFIDFTGHGCVNCREMEATVWSAPEVLEKLQNDFIILALYVDDPTELPENEWITSKYDNKIKKTIGKINSDLQITYFNNNAQPYYVILGKDGLNAPTLIAPKSYDLNVSRFVDFLEKARLAYQ